MTEITFPRRMQNLVGETTQTLDNTTRRLLRASLGAVSMTREEADHLLARGGDLFKELIKRGKKMEEKQSDHMDSRFKSWRRRGRRQINLAEEQFEQQVKNVLEMLRIPNADEVDELSQQLDKLNETLDAQLTEKQLAALPIQSYQDMTVKEIAPLLEGLDREALLIIQRFEMAHSNRVTILRDIEQRLQDMEPIAESA